MNEIRYDHQNITSIAAALHEQAAALRTDAREGVRAALDAIIEESSRYTRAGTPAPIYAEVIAEARAALDVLVAKATELAAAMDRHAEVLTAGVSGAQALEAESAAAMSAIDFDTGPVNTQKPAPADPTPTAPAPAPVNTPRVAPAAPPPAPVNVQKPAPADPTPAFRPLYGT